MRRSETALCVAVAMVLAASTWGAGPRIVSKRFLFKPGVVLEIGAEAGEGLRLDSVAFQVSKEPRRGLFLSGPRVVAKVTVSNTGMYPRRAGLAIALFDRADRLVGVASGGNRWGRLGPGAEATYTLKFRGVNYLAPKAATFQITLEPRP